MWALDLGTTNTSLSYWEESTDRPRLLDLPELRRRPDEEDALEAPIVIPSAVQLDKDPAFSARLGSLRPFAPLLWGRLALIGQAALDYNTVEPRPGFAPTFKRALGESPLRTLATARGRAISARDVAWLFLRELVRAVKVQTGERIRELTLTTPVDAYESYRAELQSLTRRVGIRKLHFLDEPVAAAIGYGLAIERRRRVLVVDFGGGTLNMALVELEPRTAERGGCRVIAKAGAPVGGNVVDGWLLEEFCRNFDYPLVEATDAETRFWQRMMLNEARRIKEAVFFRERARFELVPPEELQTFERRLRREKQSFEVSRTDVIAILERRGLYRLLHETLAEVLGPGLETDGVDDVLLVGGSTLLPNVFGAFESLFGRDRVRSWQPFEAVAYGACAHAAGRVQHTDFIVHDYALLTHHPKTGDPEYTVIVPRGTRFPTPPDLWKRRLVPTCARGEPERFFKLVVCEIGEGGSERTFGWDANGILYKLGGENTNGDERLIVKLNESNPTVGELDPPHPASDRNARLELAFGVNADRWLCATAFDLKTKKQLSREEPVVRLL